MLNAFIWQPKQKKKAAKALFNAANQYEKKPLKYRLAAVKFLSSGTAILERPKHTHTILYGRFNPIFGFWEVLY